MKIYLDTTIPSYAISPKKTPEIEITKSLIERIKKKEFTPYISYLTIEELEDTQDKNKRRELLLLISLIETKVIKPDEKIPILVKRYIKEKIMPKKAEADAFHIAAAVLAGIPVIVTWNLKHMANVFVKRKVNALNLQEGYPLIDMITPWEI